MDHLVESKILFEETKIENLSLINNVINNVNFFMDVRGEVHKKVHLQNATSTTYQDLQNDNIYKKARTIAFKIVRSHFTLRFYNACKKANKNQVNQKREILIELNGLRGGRAASVF